MIGSNADIDFVLEESGEAVTYGAQSCFGILDRETLNALEDDGLRILGERITLAVRHDALANLANDTGISVAGDKGGDFLIRDIGNPQADGLRLLTLVEDV